MRKEIRNWRLVAALFFLAAAQPAAGQAEQPEQPVLSWDCWVSSDSPVAINCIRDRGGELPHPSDQFEDDLEELLLDHIHYQLHSGDTSAIDQLFRENVRIFQRDSIWHIMINTPPYDSSWDEGRPQMLVRALLCPGHLLCAVMIKRPPPQPAPPQKQKKRR